MGTFVGKVPMRSPRSPIPGLCDWCQGIHCHTTVFAIAAEPRNPESTEGAIAATPQGAPQPRLLRARGAVSAQAHHQFALLTKLVKLADLLWLIPVDTPPGCGEL